MARQTPATDGPTPVTIYGRTYQLRGGGQAHMEQLASIVDDKMREVADATGTADTLKVAILASLNIADEYLRVQSGGSAPKNAELRKRLDRMVTLLDEALAE
jgi:cell division protein ZapA